MVVDRVRVEIAAGGLGLARDLPHAAGGGALEEHVLEHVGDADHVIGFVEVADLHVRDDGHHRRRRITAHEEREAVRQDLTHRVARQREPVAH